MAHDTHALPNGTTLHGKSFIYRIDSILGQGSFGITYLASIKVNGTLGSIDANVKVTVKEFFMEGFNGRTGCTVTSGTQEGMYSYYKHKFTQEAINLSKLHHPNIVNVLEAFEENNTVYYAMEYVDGGSLDKKIEQLKALDEAQCIELTRQIGSAITSMHNNLMLHLDLKPSNIMLKQNGDAVLIDFGLSKQYDENGDPETLTKVGGGTPGYAPIEQISYRDGKGFPVTMDIYALGGTMYKMLTGMRPPEAADILEDGFPLYELTNRHVSEHTAAVIAKAMMPQKSKRYQSVMEMIDDLTSTNTPAAKGNNKTESIEMLPIPEGIHIKFDKRGEGLSYEIYMNRNICNTVSAYYNEKNKADADFHGGIYEDVQKHLKKNDFLNPQHWEYESITTPIGQNFGYDIMIDFYYSDRKTFSRHVQHAHPQWHARLLNAIEKLIEETSLKQQIEQIAHNVPNPNIKIAPAEIRKDTSLVVIEYHPFGIHHNSKEAFVVNISPNHIKHREGIFYPSISKIQFKQFLDELAGMNLKEKRAIKFEFNQLEYSESPETIRISLFDQQKICYTKLCKQYISGQSYGNLEGNINDIKKRIIEITPHLKDYLNREWKQEQNNGFSFFGLFKKK